MSQFVFHPGSFLAEILAERQLPQAQFARAIGISRVSHVIGGSRPVTAELALRLAKAFNQTPQYWLNLQAAYDLAIARQRIGPRLKSIKAVA